MPVTYDQPVRYDHPGVTYDGTVSTVSDGNSRPTATQAKNSAPTIGGGFSSRPETT